MTIKDLQAIKDKLAKRINDRKLGLSKAEQSGKQQILVCASTGCLSNKAKEVIAAFEKSIKAHNLQDKVEVSPTGCHGLCSQGPVVLVYPEGIFYRKVTKDAALSILSEHILGGRPVKEHMWPSQLDENKNILPLNKTHFYKNQIKIALKNAGVIDPENIEDALELNYTGNNPQFITRELKKKYNSNNVVLTHYGYYSKNNKKSSK